MARGNHKIFKTFWDNSKGAKDSHQRVKMKKLIKKFYEALTRESEVRGCNGGSHAQLTLIHTDSYGKMMFYCKQCGRCEHY